jgi:hypothetical protein
MIKLDDNLLQELGLAALPPEEKKKMLAHIYETLEMRVGMELAKQMTEAQLSEFEQFINRNDEAGALHWLETNFPHYKQVVADEFEKLKAEIRAVAPQILASAAAQQSSAAAPLQPQPALGQQPAPYPPQAPGPPPPLANGYQQQPAYPPQPMAPPGQQGQQPYPGAPAPGPSAPYPPQPQQDPNQSGYDLAA